MKKFILIASLALITAGCSSSESGELTGVQERQQFEDMQPYGMVEIPQGSFMMGSSDEDLYSSYTYQPRTVQLNSYWMDETEITNNEYRQFVYWVRDSIAYKLLGETNPQKYLIEVDQYGEELPTPLINWNSKIDWELTNTDEREALEPLFITSEERFYNKKQLDTRKLNYEYFWIDYNTASKKEHNTGIELAQEFKGSAFAGRPNGIKNRKELIKKEVINIYPDTLCWMHDYAYSYNDTYTRSYFSHAVYDNYPVVGITYK
ncbi:MAG: SUMF1/EgtB/PvdO family nonheme iron enzyme, partial [Bacteroidales bacterium]